MDRRTARFVGAAVLVTAAIGGIGSVAGADQVRAAGSLLGADRVITVSDCSADQVRDAVVVVPADRFDAGDVLVTVSDDSGLASGGGVTGIASATLVSVHVPADTPAGDHAVEVEAVGTRHGEPTEVVDTLTVRVRC